MCGRSNDCKKDYFSPTDLQGVRTDIQERPELTHASVEIIAPEQYTVRPPMPPVYVFVIDISIASIQSGMLETLCTAARAALDTLPGGKRTRVAVITFDSSVYYYSCKAGQTAPKMFVMPDLDDIFLPQASDLLVNLDECREQMEYLFETLPSMHAKTQDVESAVGPALEASMKLMAPLGGKLMLFVSGIPSIGIGRLKNRENARLIGTEQEKKMLIPATDFYKKTAIKFTKYQIGVDLYMFSHSYTDVATLSQLPKLTGGQVYYYPSFTSKKLGAKFSAELTRNLTRSTGFEAVLRVRASTGVEICGYHGNFFLRGSDLLALPHVDADKAFAVELRNNETVISTSTIVVQAALLYTSTRGERRIRVHTQCLPVTQNLLDLYNNANVNAITNVMAKQAINIALNNNFHKAREFIQSKCTNIVRGYRNSLRNSGMNQKPSLSVIGTLPLMTLGLLKNAAFKEGVDVRPDVRSNVLASIFTMGVVECETFIRPRMLPLHTMTEKEGLVDEKGGVTMPQEVGLSMDQLKSDGCYLIDNGFQFVVRVGRKVDPSFAKLVLGVDSLEAANMREVRLRQPEDDGVRTSDCHRIHNILNYLRKVSSHHQDVVIVREGDSNEVYFFNFLIEDRGTGGRSMSLAEFTNHIQRNSGYN